MAAKTPQKRAALAGVQPPQVFYRINTLLYTLRAIAQKEDQLCVLMHHMRTSGKLNASLRAELDEILEEIPATEYLHDLQALRASLEEVQGAAPAAPAKATRSRTPAKSRAA